MASHSSILPWRIPWTGEPSRLQSMGLQRVRHNWANNTSLHLTKNMNWQDSIPRGQQVKTITQTMKTEWLLLSYLQSNLRTPRNKYLCLCETSSVEGQAAGTVSRPQCEPRLIQCNWLCSVLLPSWLKHLVTPLNGSKADTWNQPVQFHRNY